MIRETKLTILTPTFNKPRHIRDAAECLRLQTRQDFEWWLVADGPTDESRDAIESIIRMQPVRVFWCGTTDDERQMIYRPAAIFDEFVPHVGTPFFVWYSDDNLLDPRFVERMIGTIEDKGPNHCAVCGKQTFVMSGDDATFDHSVFPVGLRKHQLYRMAGTDNTLFGLESLRKLMPLRLSTLTPFDPLRCERSLIVSAFDASEKVHRVNEILVTHRITELSYSRNDGIRKYRQRHGIL